MLWEREGYFDGLSHIHKILEHYMAPFKPGRLMTYVQEDIYGSRLRIDISALPNDPVLIDVRPLVTRCSDVGFIMTEIGLQAAKHFTSVPTLPVDDHIELGYN